MKQEHANNRTGAARTDARRDVIRWIERWFNTRLLHSTIGYETLFEHENRYYRRGDQIAA